MIANYDPTWTNLAITIISKLKLNIWDLPILPSTPLILPKDKPITSLTLVSMHIIWPSSIKSSLAKSIGSSLSSINLPHKLLKTQYLAPLSKQNTYQMPSGQSTLLKKLNYLIIKVKYTIIPIFSSTLYKCYKIPSKELQSENWKTLNLNKQK